MIIINSTQSQILALVVTTQSFNRLFSEFQSFALFNLSFRRKNLPRQGFEPR